MSKQATFTEMLNGTAEDYAIIGEQTSEYAQQLPDRILEHLSILKEILAVLLLTVSHIAYKLLREHTKMGEMKSTLFVRFCMT
jgi:hypothetical protein